MRVYVPSVDVYPNTDIFNAMIFLGFVHALRKLFFPLFKDVSDGKRQLQIL